MQIILAIYIIIGFSWVMTYFKHSMGRDLAYVKYVKRTGNLLVIIVYVMVWPLRPFVSFLNKY